MGNGQDNPVLPGRFGPHLITPTKQDGSWLERALRIAELPPMTIHDLRHTAATLATKPTAVPPAYPPPQGSRICNLKPVLSRLAAFAIDIAQSIVASLGGGNGDPTVLHEPVKSAGTPQPHRKLKLKRKR